MNRYAPLLLSIGFAIGCGLDEPIAPVPIAPAVAGATASSAGMSAAAAGRSGSPAAGAGAGGSVAPSVPPPASGAGGSAGSAQAGAGGSTQAGAGGSVAPPTYAPRFSAIYNEVFQSARCTIPTCHGAALMLETVASAYTSLVGAMSTGPICGGDGKILVMPGAPDQSLLVQKLREAPPCGDRMPPGNPLSEQQLNQIVTWIQNGAKQD